MTVGNNYPKIFDSPRFAQMAPYFLSSLLYMFGPKHVMVIRIAFVDARRSNERMMLDGEHDRVLGRHIAINITFSFCTNELILIRYITDGNAPTLMNPE